MASNRTSITGRDGYILNQALLYAIAHIQSLPQEMQEWSNVRDMCLMVKANDSFFTVQQSLSVEHHTGIVPNLWPEPDEELTEEDRAARDEFEATRCGFVERMQLAISMAKEAA